METSYLGTISVELLSQLVTYIFAGIVEEERVNKLQLICLN